MIDDNRLLNVHRNSDYWILMGFAVLLLGVGLGLRDPWPADEPRFALIAKQMLESGNWWLPMRGGEIYPDKPPLFMWLIAVFYYLTGSLKISFLLPSLLASLGTLLLTIDLGKRLWGEKEGLLAGLLLLLTLQFTLQAKIAQIDALVTFFIFLGVYGFVRFLNSGTWRWYYLGCFATGLGIITKGVGIIAALVLIPAIFTHFETIIKSSLKSKGKMISGIAVMLGAIGLWLVPLLIMVAISDDPTLTAYRDNILVNQTVTRYTNSWHHVKPFWYYLTKVIPVFWLPLSLALPWLAGYWWWAVKSKDKRVIWLLGYVLLVLVFFSLSPGKRGVYMTPATPALALIAAPWLKQLIEKTALAHLWQGFGLFLMFAALVISVVLFGWPELLESNEQPVEIANLWWSALLLAALIAVIQWFLRYSPLVATTASLTASWVIYSAVCNPLINHSRTPKEIMAELWLQTQPVNSAPQDVLILSFKEQFLLFSLQPLWHFAYHMPNDRQAQAAVNWLKEGGEQVLGPAKVLAVCFDLALAVSLGERHRDQWLLVNKTLIKPKCLNESIDNKSLAEPLYYYAPTLIVGEF